MLDDMLDEITDEITDVEDYYTPRPLQFGPLTPLQFWVNVNIPALHAWAKSLRATVWSAYRSMAPGQTVAEVGLRLLKLHPCVYPTPPPSEVRVWRQHYFPRLRVFHHALFVYITYCEFVRLRPNTQLLYENEEEFVEHHPWLRECKRYGRYGRGFAWANWLKIALLLFKTGRNKQLLRDIATEFSHAYPCKFVQDLLFDELTGAIIMR